MSSLLFVALSISSLCTQAANIDTLNSFVELVKNEEIKVKFNVPAYERTVIINEWVETTDTYSDNGWPASRRIGRLEKTEAYHVDGWIMDGDWDLKTKLSRQQASIADNGIAVKFVYHANNGTYDSRFEPKGILDFTINFDTVNRIMDEYTTSGKRNFRIDVKKSDLIRRD